MKSDRYRKVIEMYIEAGKKDLKEAETEEEEHVALYLIRELESIINDVENRGLGK